MVASMVMLVFAADLDARGRGRGGGRSFSRSGVASSGRIAPRSRFTPQRSSTGRRQKVSPQGQRQRYLIRNQGGSQIQARPQVQGYPQSQRRNRSGDQLQGGQLARPQSQIATRSDRKTDRSNLEDRQQWRDEHREDIQQEIGKRQEDRQNFAKDRQEDRQEFAEDMHHDHWDDHHDHWDDDDGEFAAGAIVGGMVGVAVGAAAASTSSSNTTHVYHETTYVPTLPCTPQQTVVNGVTYYRCGNDWFQRSFIGNQVTYIVVPPPAGY